MSADFIKLILQQCAELVHMVRSCSIIGFCNVSGINMK
jgi:hypothetical protein